MASQVALQMMKRRHNAPDTGGGFDGEVPGHPHMENEHEGMDRQHSYESAVEGLQSLAKDNMPGAEDLLKQLQKTWATWQGDAGMQPATTASHKASPVSKSAVDQADENITAPENEPEFDASKE